jgi:hypothetical protein
MFAGQVTPPYGADLAMLRAQGDAAVVGIDDFQD